MTDPSLRSGIPLPGRGLARRDILKGAALGAAGLGAGSLLEACSSGLKGSGSSGGSTGSTLKIGYVSPQTGSLASFALADDFIVKTVTDVLGKGVTAANKNYKIEIVVKDSQSSSTRAADMARELIFTDKADLIVSS